MLNTSFWLPPSDLLGKTVDCLSLEQANTVSGICYTFLVNCKVPSQDMIELYLNLNHLTDQSMTFIIHHPAGIIFFLKTLMRFGAIVLIASDVVGNNFNVHTGEVVVESVVEDADSAIILFEKRKARNHANNTVTEEEHYRCCARNVREVAIAMAEAGYICYYPAFEDVLGEEVKNCCIFSDVGFNGTYISLGIQSH